MVDTYFDILHNLCIDAYAKNRVTVPDKIGEIYIHREAIEFVCVIS